ncbi:MAG: hypothetical protein ACLQVJ_10175 [Syntrophobacteraceae bacterium]
MKLLCITYCGEDQINGYVEITEEGVYACFRVWPGKIAMIDSRFPRKNYRSYRYFAAVLGKGDPYAFLLKKPIKIPALDFDLLTNLYLRTPALRIWEQPSNSK